MTFRSPLRLVIACVVPLLWSCGGGGGDGSGNPPQAKPPRVTTFVGNVSQASAATSAGDDSFVVAGFPPSVVQVCVAGTGFCTTVDQTGAFTLAANVGGDVVLLFDGPNFSARLPLQNVPRGATVRIDDIVCDPGTGRCRADDVEILPALNRAPDCSGADARPAVLWPPNHALVRIGIVGIVDPDGDPIVITATDVTSNEAVNAPGSGNTAPDAQLSPLAVRAERSGQGDGRVYAISFIADDGHGGACSGTVFVCVPHDQGKKGSSCG